MRRHFTRITKFDVFTAISLIALFFVILSGIIAPKSEGELDEVIITVRAEGVSTALAEELSGAELFWLEDKYTGWIKNLSPQGSMKSLTAVSMKPIKAITVWRSNFIPKIRERFYEQRCFRAEMSIV